MPDFDHDYQDLLLLDAVDDALNRVGSHASG